MGPFEKGKRSTCSLWSVQQEIQNLAVSIALLPVANIRAQDPELWLLGNGNDDCVCFIYLYEKGQSERGPAFRIPFASLLSAQCQPLIERFVDRSVSEEDAYQNGRVDLYIPAPAGASRSQAAQYHLAIRNLVAWVSRRSVVGEHLGGALIALTHAIDDFREPQADTQRDLLSYLDEEGYLDMRNQPDHALGILHLAEVLQMQELYTDAFAHCVGMSELLYKHSEYSVSAIFLMNFPGEAWRNSSPVGPSWVLHTNTDTV